MPFSEDIVVQLYAQLASFPIVLAALRRCDEGGTTVETQRRLMARLSDEEPFLAHPPPPSYHTKFLSRYADTAMKDGRELDDGLSLKLTEGLRHSSAAGSGSGSDTTTTDPIESELSVGLKGAELGYASYWVCPTEPRPRSTADPAVVPVTIRLTQMRHLIGLALWPATFTMIDYFLDTDNTHLLAGKHVLELGSGTGLAGLTVANNLPAASFTLTDTGDDVLANLRHNLSLNPAQPGGCPAVNVSLFDWEHPEEALASLSSPPDIIVASDIVYDPVLHLMLCRSLAVLCGRAPGVSAYIVCSVRAESTFDKFVDTAESRGLAVEVLGLPSTIPPDGHEVDLWTPAGGAVTRGTRVVHTAAAQEAQARVIRVSMAKKDESADREAEAEAEVKHDDDDDR